MNDDDNKFDDLDTFVDSRYKIIAVSDPWTEQTKIREETYRGIEFADGRSGTLWFHPDGWWREIGGRHYDGGYYYKDHTPLSYGNYR